MQPAADATRRDARSVRLDRTICVMIVIALLAFYIAIQRGEYVSWDGRVIAGTASNLWTHHRVETLGSGFPENPSLPYFSIYGIGMSLLLAPLWPLQHGLDPLGAQWLTVANPLVLAVCGAILYRIAIELNMRRSTAVGVAFTFGVLTMAPMYSTELFAEPGITLGTLLAVLGCIRWRGGRRSGPWLLAVGTASAIVFRPDSALLVGIALLLLPLFVPWDQLKATVRSWLPVLALPIGAAVVWTGYYNNLRYGSAFTTSYPGVGFTNPILDGVQRQLLSPGKGFFWYDPILLAALPGLVWLWRRDRAVTALILVIAALRVLLFAKWPFPDGTVAWGPRFLLPCCALLVVPLGECWEQVGRWAKHRLGARTAIVVFGALSAVVVLASVWVPYEQYWTTLGKEVSEASPATAQSVLEHGMDGSYNTVSGSPLVVNLRHLDSAEPFPLRWFRGGPTPFGIVIGAVSVSAAGLAFLMAMASDRRRG